jgi:phosphoribosylamine--glycine ligase
MCVVLAAQGYPETYRRGELITLPEGLPEGVAILHAGTVLNAEGALVANGGRVLGVTALGSTLRSAAEKAYAVCERIGWSGKYFRRDIGARQFQRDRS